MFLVPLARQQNPFVVCLSVESFFSIFGSLVSRIPFSFIFSFFVSAVLFSSFDIQFALQQSPILSLFLFFSVSQSPILIFHCSLLVGESFPFFSVYSSVESFTSFFFDLLVSRVRFRVLVCSSVKSHFFSLFVSLIVFLCLLISKICP